MTTSMKLFACFMPIAHVGLLELVLLYLAVGFLGWALENNAGQVASQGWEFYAITATMFLTFAFPGFCYRYLLKRRG